MFKRERPNQALLAHVHHASGLLVFLEARELDSLKCARWLELLRLDSLQRCVNLDELVPHPLNTQTEDGQQCHSEVASENNLTSDHSEIAMNEWVEMASCGGSPRAG